MASQVVTIAMTTGADAEVIGRAVADRLGFQYVSDEIIDGAAARAGVSREAVADVERSPSLMSRIMAALATGAVGAAGEPLTAAHLDSSPSYERLIQDVIRQTAAKGNVVILAHGASIVLSGTPTHYDLVINTDVLSADEAARIIATAAGKG